MATLCLYTANFPYGQGEQFIETEIQYLVNSFEKVIIIPRQKTTDQRQVPSNVQVIIPEYSGYTTAKGLKQLGKWIFLCLKDIVHAQKKKSAISAVIHAGYNANILYRLLAANNLHNEKVLHYTYWFDEYSVSLSILKSKQLINFYISRAHGFDLYTERRKEKFIPFRKLQLNYVDKLCLISHNGLDYMKDKYPKYAGKFDLSYLGVVNNTPFHYIGKSEKYLIVSCSRMVDIKRIDLIVKSLALIMNMPIRWIHFGDGTLLRQIKNLAEKILPENIEVDFRRHVDNQVIYEFYRNNHIDCLINLSSSEGLPVSIMEAVSYGIPVVATDVGGISEIVTNQTGTLLKENFKIEDAKNAILDILYNKSDNIEFRKEIYEFWKQNFNAEKNYLDFIDKIKNNFCV